MIQMPTPIIYVDFDDSVTETIWKGYSRTGTLRLDPELFLE